MQRPLLCVLNLKLLAVRSTVWFLLPDTCGKAGLRRESVGYLGLPTSMRELTIAGLFRHAAPSVGSMLCRTRSVFVTVAIPRS